MRTSQLFTKTRRQAPADEKAKNAQLLIRAGYIHKEMAGVYAYLPLGKRVIDNITRIIREEMNNIGGQEVQMTTLQPKELFEKTDRWDDAKVDNWFKTKLASGAELGMGLTHEEPIVSTLSDFVNSYKDLPIYIYQIQAKFRNELRAKSGLLRGREFLMKDMYSFARSQSEHHELYERVAKVYNKIYQRLGIGDITYRTYADGGYFTTNFSDEFQTLSPIGEDTIYLHEGKKVAINQEIYTDENLAKLGLNKPELVEKRGIEVGNIFPLESKYTDALGVYYSDEQGKQQSIIVGCYGIGISRLMGTIAELFADDKGLVWPAELAPAQVYLVRLGNDSEVVKQADELHDKLEKAGISVLYDDSESRTGEKFANADLIGLPSRIIISEKTLKGGKYEYKTRSGNESVLLSETELLNKLNG